MVQWLWQLDQDINIHAENEDAFISSCEGGHLEISQWLWNLNQNINIHVENELAFRHACLNDHLDTVKWLWQLGNIDIHAEEDTAFRYACEEGNLEIAKWLSQLDQNIDIRAYNEGFRFACENDNLEMAKWLWQSCKNIDLHADDEYAFTTACEWNKLQVAQWLSTLCDNYVVVINDGKITKWLIRNENYIILELIENNKYSEAISRLNIKSMSSDIKHECMVCHDLPSDIIKLPCNHTLCLESVVRFNITNKNITNRCFYCQKKYKWNRCVSLYR